jgi:uncharacterized protein YcbK (DUF882 family)
MVKKERMRYTHTVRFVQFASICSALAAFAVSSSAAADVQHVVARGHTLNAIAARYHVSAKAIIDANHLRDPSHLRAGQTLTIPGVSANPTTPHVDAHGHTVTTPTHPVTYAMRPRTPGIIHVHRIATNEDAVIRVGDRRGRLPPVALKTAEHIWRYPNGQTHDIDARLLALLGVVSNHFGSRRIDIISGFRPYSPTQYTPHSNHNIGHAVDFRVEGVPNEAVRDFCKTLRNVGCGYYPNSVFVHMDSRASSAYWIDYSKPGEPPKYDAPNPAADEGTTDVADEMHTATPSEQNAKPADTQANPQTTPPPATTGTTTGSETTPANPVNTQPQGH